MSIGMAVWLSLTVAALAAGRALGLCILGAQLDAARVERVAGYPRGALAPAFLMPAAGVVMLWLAELAAASGLRPGMYAALALLMAAFLGMCLLVERKRIVVAGERIVVQPALGRRREFTFRDIESVRITALGPGRGVDMLRVRAQRSAAARHGPHERLRHAAGAAERARVARPGRALTIAHRRCFFALHDV